MSIARPAGLNERRCIARESLGLYGNIITVATYTKKGPSRKLSTIFEDELVEILSVCIDEHAVLSTCIQNADTEKPLLLSVPSTKLDLKNHIRIADLTDATSGPDDQTIQDSRAKGVQAVLEKAHNEPLANWDTVPPWRVHIFRSQALSPSIPTRFHLAFVISHALVDGSSGIACHSTFARALGQLSTSGEDFEIEELPSAGYPFLPPLEVAAKMPISWSFLLRPALSEFLPFWLASALGVKDTSTDGAWCGAPVRPKRAESAELLTTAVHTRFVSQRSMQRALDVCKSQKVRFTGLVTHLTAKTLAHVLRTRGKLYNRFLAEIAIDLRRCVPEARGRMANYVSAATVAIPVLWLGTRSLANEDWLNMQAITAHLAERSNTLTDQPTALLKYLPNIRTWVAKQSTKPPTVSFGVSNLGLVKDFPYVLRNAAETGEWAMEDITFSQSADGMGPPFNLNVASVKGGSTALTITWWPAMLGVENEQGFIEEVMEGIAGDIETL